MAVIRTWEYPIFTYWKKHKCYKCGDTLDVVKFSQVVNAKSSEAKNFDFSCSSGGRYFGDVKFIWEEFVCPRCNTRISIKEMKKRERNKC